MSYFGICGTEWRVIINIYKECLEDIQSLDRVVNSLAKDIINIINDEFDEDYVKKWLEDEE